MYKIIFLVLLLAQFAYKLVLQILSNKQVGKPLPESVADIYDSDEYDRWRRYNNKKRFCCCWYFGKGWYRK